MCHSVSISIPAAKMAEPQTVNPMSTRSAGGMFTHLLDLLDKLVLQIRGQVFDGADDVLFLRALHGGAEDEQQQAVHLGERRRGRRVLAYSQRVG